MRVVARLLALSCLIAAPAALASPPPHLGDVAPQAPKPYDEQADAHAQLDAALDQAKREAKPLMIVFGGNWCPDCRALAGVLALPDVAAWQRQSFVLVDIDVGRFTRNLDLGERWNIRVHAAPTVLVVRPDGTLVNRDHVFALSDARGLSPQAVVDQLAQWVGP